MSCKLIASNWSSASSWLVSDVKMAAKSRCASMWASTQLEVRAILSARCNRDRAVVELPKHAWMTADLTRASRVRNVYRGKSESICAWVKEVRARVKYAARIEHAPMLRHV